ncbi:MAG TPA: hypothetical protein VMA09_03935 [Candidatus Binataceae bacterium]|nr:hypothetical protein [Candidatus Binataceae bacterium]
MLVEFASFSEAVLHAFELAPQVRAFHRVLIVLDARDDVIVAGLIADVDPFTAQNA